MRAILSVSDKSGLIDLAKGLTDLAVELISTGGTARAIAGAGLPVMAYLSRPVYFCDSRSIWSL